MQPIAQDQATREGLLKAVRGNDGRLLIGLTGTIACGKSTVAEMLAQKGAHVIDFDLLARRIVEPGRPALTRIAAQFGPEVLLPDGGLDRKALSGIVFGDEQKRRILEGITHPAINLEFLIQLEDICSADPNAIVLAVIPLLIEAGMQFLFHKLLVVYVPQDELARRLMKRDNIDRASAERIIATQMPMDRKRALADFVVNNGGDLAATRAQVDGLWPRLQALQRQTAAARPDPTA